MGTQRSISIQPTGYTEVAAALLLWVAVVSVVLAEAAGAALGEVEAPGVAVRLVAFEKYDYSRYFIQAVT